MLYRVTLVLLSIGLLFIVGCRTGEYPVDTEIYEMMPQLLMANPELESRLMKNEDGTLMIEFDKGIMFLYLALKLDPITGKKAVNDALQIFHDQYMTNPGNLKGNGSFYRQIIGVKAYVEDIELYVIQWDLAEENCNVLNDRYGNFV